MSKLIAIVVAFWLVSGVYAWTYNQLRPFVAKDQSEFTGVLILQWPPAYCQHLSFTKSGSCSHQKLALWDHLSFTVGGFWMSSRSPDAFEDLNQPRMTLNKALVDRLLNYWPNFLQTSPPEPEGEHSHAFWLWRNEWNTYGKDYAYAYERLFAVDLASGEQAMEEVYFDDALKLYERRFYEMKKLIKSSILHPEKDFILERAEIGNLLSLENDQFTILCVPGTRLLYHIQICLSVDQDQTVPTNCDRVAAESASQVSSTCPELVELLNYGAKDETVSGRVTQYQLVEQTGNGEF